MARSFSSFFVTLIACILDSVLQNAKSSSPFEKIKTMKRVA